MTDVNISSILPVPFRQPECSIDDIAIYEYPNPLVEISQPSTNNVIVVRSASEAVAIIASLNCFLNAIGGDELCNPKWISIAEKPPEKGRIAWMKQYPNGHRQHWVSTLDQIGWANNIDGFHKPLSDLDATHWHQMPK